MKKVLEKLIYSSARRGSALIMTVVLTVLLALIGALFVMGARLDKMATASISENKELEAGVDAVVEKISQELVDDVPGMPGAEYYDYVGPGDSWLASLEPYGSDPNFYWGQISDVTGYLAAMSWQAQDIRITNSVPDDLKKAIVAEHQKIVLADPDDEYSDLLEQLADADGDGVADSRWIVLPDITTAKGKPIFAAIRIIDQGAMLNVNTAYKFDPATAGGSSQMQINLAGLSQRGSNGTLAAAADKLQQIRCGTEPLDIFLYEDNVIWQYGEPIGSYTPFDISDELKLRNRYILNYNLITTRIEELWESAYDGGLEMPRTKNSQLTDPNDGRWFWRTNYGLADPCNAEAYDYRHISTTYNFDRVIKPDGEKMVNVNAISSVDDVNDLYQALYDGITGLSEPNRIPIVAQLAVNIVDFADGDADVTPFSPDGGTTTYYGFEAQPFISEIGCKIDISDPNYNEYAVELYNPFDIPVPLDGFTLSISNGTDIGLTGSIGPKSYYVIASDASAFTITVDPNQVQVETDLKLSDNCVDTNDDWQYDICDNYDLTLKRTVDTADGTTTIEVDRQKTDYQWFIGTPGATEKYPQRDDDNWHIVYQTMKQLGETKGSLGTKNDDDAAITGKKNYNLTMAETETQASFVTIGDVALPLYIGHGEGANSTVGEKLDAQPLEKNIRLDLTNPAFRNIFRHLTVFPPKYVSDPDETRVKGRININTAPWFVIAQLPWMTDEIAQAIVAYRDKLAAPVDYFQAGAADSRSLATGISGLREKLGFESIGELNFVTAGPDEYRIDYYATAAESGDLMQFPDLTSGDGAPDDFEERNVIFSRISNLVTVRSDVFCAYILIRLGTDGPQKRVMVILDRSGVSSPSDKVKIVAYHPVPDPR